MMGMVIISSNLIARERCADYMLDNRCRDSFSFLVQRVGRRASGARRVPLETFYCHSMHWTVASSMNDIRMEEIFIHIAKKSGEDVRIVFSC